MNIGLDARTLSTEGGSKVYAVNLINHLNSKNIFLFGIDKYKDFKCIPSTIKSTSIKRLYYEYSILPKLLQENKIDVFHGVKASIPLKGNSKKIISVLDLSPYVFPDYFNFKDMIYWKYFLKLYLRRADKIIAISTNTKNDLVKYLKIDPEKIRVVYLSHSSEYFKVKTKKDSYQSVKKYLQKNNISISNLEKKKIILNVNTVQPRKNISNLIKAFNECETKDTILLIIGKKGWKYEEIMKVYEESPKKDQIFFLGFTSDEDLSYFYNIATVFVYPSFYEGFGIPPLEAMACGCPVISSNTSSLPEVMGGTGIMVDPNNIREIARSIEMVLTNEKLRNSLIKGGLKQSKKFSWEKCAKETLEIYKEVYNGK